MYQVTPLDPDDALRQGIILLEAHGDRVPSRHGMTLESPTPVCTTWLEPQLRVSFSPERDANPFFHLMEALWIIGGRNDVDSLAPYNKNIGNYSDDGATFFGGYGARIHEKQQLDRLIKLLKDDPSTRRAVISIYDGKSDLGTASKDIPCNVSLHFIIRNGRLEMNVFNRSNDIVWGAYGANIVQFSMLQEYVAIHVGVKLGTLRQMSMSYHAYIESESSKVYDRVRTAGMNFMSPYHCGSQGYGPTVCPAPWIDFTSDQADAFMDGQEISSSVFLEAVASPLRRAWHHFKEHRDCTAFPSFEHSPVDWKRAAYKWMERRTVK